jgi:hypothetical protein
VSRGVDGQATWDGVPRHSRHRPNTIVTSSLTTTAVPNSTTCPATATVTSWTPAVAPASKGHIADPQVPMLAVFAAAGSVIHGEAREQPWRAC